MRAFTDFSSRTGINEQRDINVHERIDQPGGRQDVGAEDIVPQHRAYPRVGPPALLVTGRGERRVLVPVVLGERVQYGYVVVVHTD